MSLKLNLYTVYTIYLLRVKIYIENREAENEKIKKKTIQIFCYY